MTKALHEMKPGEKGQVIRVGGHGVIRRRMVDMGVVNGATLEVQKFAPLGDPMEIKIKGFNLSLRKNEAKWIEVALS